MDGILNTEDLEEGDELLERWERLSKLSREKLEADRPTPEEFVNNILQRGD